MTNNRPNDDSPDDDFKISEDKLREFLESSEKDFDYSNSTNNNAWGANIKDREIIDFIERVDRIRNSMNSSKSVNTPDFNEFIDRIENIQVVSQENVAELLDVFKMATDEMRLRTVDPTIIQQLADIVHFQQDRIASIIKQLSTLRMIVFALIGSVLILITCMSFMIVAVFK
jgi:uncharacterized protein (UPF0335 family)